MIDTVTIGEVTLDPALVVADITVLHGRRDPRGGPEASSATVVAIHPDPNYLPAWTGGAPMQLSGDAGPMFTGRLVEVRLEHGRSSAGAPYGLLTLVAAGPVATLGYRYVGDEPWPEESGAARAARILTLAEVPYVIDGPADAVVLPRDVDSRTALSLLADLTESTAAAVVDLPSGEVLYQPLAERARPVHPFPWADFPPDATWQQFPPAATWADFAGMHSNDSEFPVRIPASAVEWEPSWTSAEANVTNHIRVGYGVPPDGGSEQPWTELRDQASIAAHGRRYQYLGTQLRDQSDAAALASWTLTTQAEPHWRLSDIVVHLDLLDEDTRLTVLRLTTGDHVEIATMPTPTPTLIAQGIVEGWTYVLWGVDGQLFERITLHASSLLESLAVPTWADTAPDLTWAAIDPGGTWADIVGPPLGAASSTLIGA